MIKLPYRSPLRFSSLMMSMMSLDDALSALSDIDPVKAQIVELRFFGGMGVDEAASVLGLSPATIKRGWRTAKAWLRREMSRSPGKGS